MSDINFHLLSIAKFILFFLFLCLMSWILFAEVRPYAAGAALGAAAAWANFWLLSRRVKRIADNAAAGGTKRNGLGFLTRAAVAVFAVFIALRTPGVNVIAVVAGYFAVHMATLLVGWIGIHRGKG